MFRFSINLITVVLIFSSISPLWAEFRLGAIVEDITPEVLPVLINGGMLSRSADEIHTPIHARTFVIGNEDERMAIVIVDSCMMPRDLLDEAKRRASERTGIPIENMLISATHAHSVPSTFAVLGTEADANYVPFLIEKLADAITKAAERMVPARVGWAVGDAADYTAVRRWVRRPDRMQLDPFGNRTARANMHPGYRSLDATGPAGPIDPDLSVIAFQSLSGEPLALLANFSMHYYGAPSVGADYFGLFSEKITEKITGQKSSQTGFVAAMSQGTSGDIYLRDYLKPEPDEPPHDISSYTDALVEIALGTYRRIEYQENPPVAMAEAKLPLRYRIPDKQRLHWAWSVVSQIGGDTSKDRTQVYAREAIILDKLQETEIILQALRIGDLGITAMPNEVYALTGLKLKAWSPFSTTVNIELANGAEGYIPPPEQHLLGGYNTWPARSAGLEVEAEPKIVETVLSLLETVAGKPRRPIKLPDGPAVQATKKLSPLVYWRMDEFNGPRIEDSVRHTDGVYESGVVYYLDGPRSDLYRDDGKLNRSPHFAGGRARAYIEELGTNYSISLWFWNGMPNNAREVTGYLFSRGHDYAFGGAGEHLAIGGNSGNTGRIVFSSSDGKEEVAVSGKQVIERWTWNHLLLVREGARVRIYLNGQLEAEGNVPSSVAANVGQIFVGGRNDSFSNFEGRVDEVAIFDRALSNDEAI
ncbi:MAG TPA: neutral/alkaline non-lysosomal ceramidase N-terminal domain-containing protein, partial [Acidobacteriota bacterium]|nr:neutral/alkaline non-lysosomal ceramidase N-terminal domain-containing protein [Acidobacteriota bacterium]